MTEVRRDRMRGLRRALAVVGAVIGTSLTFVAATAISVVVHLDAPVTRRFVATQANGILHEQFVGDVTIEHIGGLDLHGCRGVRLRVKDREGRQVLSITGARVRVRTFEAAG